MTELEMIAALRRDLNIFAEGDRDAEHCDGCGAPLHEGDVFYRGEVVGCWGYVTGKESGAPCYRYRTEAGADRAWPDCKELEP